MRKILFRGKRKDNGEWVTGYYFERKDTKGNIIESVIIEDAYEQITNGQRYMRSNLNYECFRVDPGTVGQYTGHSDMKRKKIFEGDIIQRYKTEFNPPRKYKNPYVVSIKDEFPRAVEEYYSAFEHFTEKVGYEVIGTIHDNPELLEVSK